MKAEGHHNVTFGHSLEKNGCSWCLSVTMRAVGIQCHDASRCSTGTTREPASHTAEKET